MIRSAGRILGVLVVALLLAASYNRWASPKPLAWVRTPPPVTTTAAGEVVGSTEMTIADLKQAAAAGAILLDARPRDEFAEGYIPGAINLPWEEAKDDPSLLETELQRLDDIVVYCRSENCNDSKHLAELLTELGFQKVRQFKGGFMAWTDAGQEVAVP